MGLIESINKKHEEKMKQVTNNEINFSWDDPYLEDLIMYKMNTISCHHDEKQPVKDIVNSINSQIYKYNNGRIKKIEFLNNLKEEFQKLNTIEVKYFNYSFIYFENLVKKQTNLILHGPGGIGKSHYVYTLSNKLKNTKIKYLTLYGKWLTIDDLNVLDSEELLNEDDRLIIFIDAINEVKIDLRKILIEKISHLKGKENLSVVITYRDNAFDPTELECLGFYDELFSGVDYQQAIEELIQYTGKSIFEYEDILQTNNPLYLKILYEILKKDDYIKDKKSISSITYILEQYIKNKKCCGIDVWWFVKDIASTMFINGRKEITEEEIMKLNPENAKKWISQLMDFNFLSFYEYDGTVYYFFVMESYTDYLIARSMFDYISINKSKNNYDFIKDKIKKMPSLSELFILVIFDGIKSIEAAIKLCINCGLLFNGSVISKINFNGKDIIYFQKNFQVNAFDLFENVSGLYNKPFNCVNYFNDIFLNLRCLELFS